MKKHFLPYCMAILMSIFFAGTAAAQLVTLASGGNKKAGVSERIGLTDITIHYDRPGVKGREGQIWGKLVPVGFIDQGFGSSKAAPWRAGANENTTIEFSTDVKIEGQPLRAGKYGFFIAYDPAECTLIFSSNSTSWGSFFYNDKEDVLRVKVKPVPADKSVEWLRYSFYNETENSATIALEWEKLVIPFKVEVDYVNEQLASFRRQLRTQTGFNWEPWDQAAQWCLQRNVNTEEALLWSDSATAVTFGGSQSFQAASTKAQLLMKLNRTAEADALMKKMLPFASVQELHGYGRSLIAQKKPKEAFDVFKMNYDKNPGVFTTNVGMVRAYSAIGNYKKALELAQKALPQSDAVNKPNLERMIKLLQEGKDVN
ncbi:MAG TPA: DUF2911 domain-containing protein [Chitinophagaceae bacterium]|nr:DUF2911 domain-containing protein [Chitinophagaceae bacterium]